jgi:hypothetical protein
VTVKIVNQLGVYDAPLSRAEQLTFGSDAIRDPASGWIFQNGVGAAPRAIQAAEFQRRLADPDYLEWYMSVEPDWAYANPDLADLVKILKMERNMK